MPKVMDFDCSVPALAMAVFGIYRCRTWVISAQFAEKIMSSTIRSVSWCLMLAALLMAPMAHANNAHSADETAIRALIGNFTTRWHDNDARGLSMFWIPDGDFVNPSGTFLKGRKEIASFYAQAFSMGYSGSKATATVDQIRFLTPAVAVVDGEFEIIGTPLRDQQGLPAEKGRYTAVVERVSGRWFIVSNREMEPLKPGT